MATVKIYDNLSAPSRPHVFKDIDLENLSFIDNESHGKANEFGITTRALQQRGTKLIVSSPNVVAVEVTTA